MQPSSPPVALSFPPKPEPWPYLAVSYKRRYPQLDVKIGDYRMGERVGEGSVEAALTDLAGRLADELDGEEGIAAADVELWVEWNIPAIVTRDEYNDVARQGEDAIQRQDPAVVGRFVELVRAALADDDDVGGGGYVDGRGVAMDSMMYSEALTRIRALSGRSTRVTDAPQFLEGFVARHASALDAMFALPAEAPDEKAADLGAAADAAPSLRRDFCRALILAGEVADKQCAEVGSADDRIGAADEADLDQQAVEVATHLYVFHWTEIEVRFLETFRPLSGGGDAA